MAIEMEVRNSHCSEPYQSFCSAIMLIMDPRLQVSQEATLKAILKKCGRPMVQDNGVMKSIMHRTNHFKLVHIWLKGLTHNNHRRM